MYNFHRKTVLKGAANVANEKKLPAPTDHPMKWYKFLIWFGLWAGAALLAVQGIGYLTGISYKDGSGLSADTVYGTYPGLRVWDRIYGAGLLALGALNIFTRFRLSGFKENGPKCLYIVYALEAVLAVVNAITVATITGVSGSVRAVVSVLAAIVLILLNRSYFAKRAELFVN